MNIFLESWCGVDSRVGQWINFTWPRSFNMQPYGNSCHKRLKFIWLEPDSLRTLLPDKFFKRWQVLWLDKATRSLYVHRYDLSGIWFVTRSKLQTTDSCRSTNATALAMGKDPIKWQVHCSMLSGRYFHSHLSPLVFHERTEPTGSEF